MQKSDLSALKSVARGRLQGDQRDGWPWQRHRRREQRDPRTAGPAFTPSEGPLDALPLGSLPRALPLDALSLDALRPDELPLDALSLDALRPGSTARVSAVGTAHAGDLAQHGVVAGAIVRIESRAPFGGPLVVTIGRARLAIGAAVARSILVDAAGLPPRGDGPEAAQPVLPDPSPDAGRPVLE